MSAATRRVAVLGLDHMHAGDQAELATRLPGTELVGVVDADQDRLDTVCQDLGIEAGRRFTDWRRCLELTRPDIACVCSTTAEHARWTERLAGRGIHVVVEKPFAESTGQAARMTAAAAGAGVRLVVNWPTQWLRSHQTTRRLITEGAVGQVTEVHYYGGNRGPLWHAHGRQDVDAGGIDPATTWWYSKAAGGGSLRDYLGYGATLGTWFRDGAVPTEVTATVHVPEGREVDEQSVVVASYPTGLSTFQTRWGTFTDPWTHQPQPRCGFVLLGTEGTVSSLDYGTSVHLQTRKRPEGFDLPVDEPPAESRSALAALVHALDTGQELDGPLTPAVSLVGQQLIDAAVESATLRRPVRLPVAAAATDRQDQRK